jgi:hypothetical protein
MEQSEQLVDYMVNSICIGDDEREKFLLRQALLGLVKMAKAERTIEIERDFEHVNHVMETAGKSDI